MKIEQKSQKLIKSTIHKLISNISIIAIIIALVVIAMCYAGLTFSISAKIVVTVAVSSIVLAISSIIIYELWVKNGIQNAREEVEYTQLLKEYENKSKDINPEIMQEFLDAEKVRRRTVEENKLSNEIDRLERIIKHIDVKSKFGKLRLKWNNHKLAKLHKLKDNIIVDMPYEYSEQFDQLRYNTADSIYKEYKPNDSALYIRRKRLFKYTMLISTTVVGLNTITPTIGGQNWMIAIFMTTLSAIALISSVVSGFSTGYNSISISSTGIYKTALSFINKAEAYCIKYNKELRYSSIKNTNDIPEELKKIDEPIQVPSEENKNIDAGQITMDIFDNLLK